MKRLLAATVLLAAVAAPAAAAPEAQTAATEQFEALKQDPEQGRYWRALDEAFPGQGPALLARGLADGANPARAAELARAQADAFASNATKLFNQSPDEALIGYTRTISAGYHLAVDEGVRPCGDRPISPTVTAANADIQTAAMEVVAAGRRTPVQRGPATRADLKLLEAENARLQRLLEADPATRLCAPALAYFDALLSLPPDVAGRILAGVTGRN